MGWNGGNSNGTIRSMSPDELRAFMAGVGQYGYPQDRAKWRAIFCLLATYGPRVSEVLELRREDVDFARAQIRFPTLKRWKTVNGVRARLPLWRALPLYPAVATVLRAYLDTARLGLMVFPVTKRKTGRTTIWRAFQHILRRAGVTHYRLHDLRHTAASRIAQHTRDSLMVRDVLGHANVATSNIYLHAVNLEKRLLAVPPVCYSRRRKETP